MSLQVINGPVIAAGESLSDGIDLAGGQLVRITAPFAWSGANISFQISSDGNGYNDLYTADGNEVVIPCRAGRAIVIEWPMWWKAVAFLKIRSGSGSSETVQTERQEFAVAVWVETPNP
jgi:hypothetical protein